MKTVLIALDYDPNSKHIAKIGHQMASAIGAKTILLHIVPENPNYTPMLYDPVMGSIGGFDYNVFSEVANSKGYLDAGLYYLDKIKHGLKDENIEILIKIGEASDAILAVATERKAEMIVVGSHSKKWLEKILIGSVTESVLSDSKIPLLIIPTKK